MVLTGVTHLLLERRVTPSEVAVAEVKLDQATANIEVGETVKLTATVVPSDATDKTISYVSSDETIATVASDGTVAGVKAGTATITVTAGAKTATAEITVTEAA